MSEYESRKLNIYQEPEEIDEEIEEGVERDEEDYEGNIFVDDDEVAELLGKGISDPDVLKRIRKRAEEERALRRKTDKEVGDFKIDLITALTFSPSQVKQGWKDFWRYIFFGKFKPKRKDPKHDKDGFTRSECGDLRMIKRNAFWRNFLKKKFLEPGAIGAVVLAIAIWALYHIVPWLKAGFGLFKLLLLILMSVVVWVTTKVLLDSLIILLNDAYDHAADAKDKAIKAKKARREARKKQRAQQRTAEQRQNETENQSQREENPSDQDREIPRWVQYGSGS